MSIIWWKHKSPLLVGVTRSSNFLRLIFYEKSYVKQEIPEESREYLILFQNKTVRHATPEPVVPIPNNRICWNSMLAGSTRLYT